MNRLFYSLCCMLFGSFLSAQSYDNQEVLEKWQNACQYTKDIWDLFPDSTYNFHPTNEQMTVQEQMVHMMKNITWLSSKYLLETENPFSFEDPVNIDSLWPAVCAYGAEAIEASEIQLDSAVQFFAGPKTKRQIVWLLHDHQTHHRGQLIVYMRLLGLKPAKYVGW